MSMKMSKSPIEMKSRIQFGGPSHTHTPHHSLNPLPDLDLDLDLDLNLDLDLDLDLDP